MTLKMFDVSSFLFNSSTLRRLREKVKRCSRRGLVSSTKSAARVGTCSIIELLPPELFLQLSCLLDTHSMANLLRVYDSLCIRAVIILGPQHEGLGEPCFFREIRSTVCHYKASSEYLELPYLIKLFEINTRAPSFERFIETELTHVKSMSFIHFIGDIDVMGNTSIQKSLNSMHPYSPRLSFEYRVDSSSGKSESPRKFFSNVHDLKWNVKTQSDMFTNVSISTIKNVRDLRLPNVKQMEIHFYRSTDDTIRTICNIDLPRVEIFTVKYYQLTPRIWRSKIGYISKDNADGGNIFQLFDTSGFDVHYGRQTEHITEVRHYKRLMNLKFTLNFEKFYFVGGNYVILFNSCDFTNATSFFWYDTVLSDKYLDQFPNDKLEAFMLPPYRGAPLLKSFTYFTNMDGIHLPTQFVLPLLEVVRVYTNTTGLRIGGLIHNMIGTEVDLGDVDRSYHSSLRIVDICCDLPIEEVGGDGHMILDGWDIDLILYSDKMQYVNISGCYFGEENVYLSEDYTRLVDTVPYEGSESDEPPDKIMRLELVRKINTTEVDQQLYMDFFTLECLCSYLTSLRITQAVGGSGYTPWKEIAAVLPDYTMINKLVLEIDTSLDIFVVLVDRDGLILDSKFDGEHDDSSECPTLASGRHRLLKQWTVQRCVPTRADPWTIWSMVPNGFLEIDY